MQILRHLHYINIMYMYIYIYTINVNTWYFISTIPSINPQSSSTLGAPYPTKASNRLNTTKAPISNKKANTTAIIQHQLFLKYMILFNNMLFCRKNCHILSPLALWLHICVSFRKKAALSLWSRPSYSQCCFKLINLAGSLKS